MTTVVVEDQTFLRDILAEVCRRDLEHEKVIAASDGQKGLEAIILNRPQFVMLDLELPSRDGFGVIEAARLSGISPRFLIFSSYLDPYTVYRVDQAKVAGFMDKELQGLDALRSAIRTVSEGGTYFSREFSRLKALRHADPESFDKMFTPREITILTMVGDGLNDHEIASELDINDETAARHRYNIRAKLGTKDKVLDNLDKYARTQGFRRSVVRRPNP